MYTWLWRHLPGTTALRALQAFLLFAAVALLLLFVIFPWAELHVLPFDSVTIDNGGSGGGGAVGGS